jgi:transcriptional regulator GlxA family with amidase domain
VDEVKSMMRNPVFDNLTILGIAFDCGFIRNRHLTGYLKNLRGFTPSEYKKQVLKRF